MKNLLKLITTCIVVFILILTMFNIKVQAKSLEIEEPIKIALSGDIFDDIAWDILPPGIKDKTGVIDPDDFEPDAPSQADIDPIVSRANVIVGIIRAIGVVVIFVTLLVLGIKYMTGSIEEKAEYKKTMIPYIIGAFVCLAITQILAVIIEIVQDMQ